MAILDEVKKSLRITSSTFDDELTNMIAAAKLDLKIAGIEHADLSADNPTDALIVLAIETYCKMHWPGFKDDYADLKASYDEQKAQLTMAAGYTDYSMVDE